MIHSNIHLVVEFLLGSPVTTTTTTAADGLKGGQGNWSVFWMRIRNTIMNHPAAAAPPVEDKGDEIGSDFTTQKGFEGWAVVIVESEINIPHHQGVGE